jgi:hypothetical protein
MRCILAVRDVRSLFRLVAALKAAFGGSFPKHKNIFGDTEMQRASRFHLTSLMLTVRFDPGITFGDLFKDAKVQTSWMVYVDNVFLPTMHCINIYND